MERCHGRKVVGLHYEKYGMDVDMIYVGASPVIIQAMLGGQAGVGAGGGPPLVTNVLRASPKISPSGRNDNCASCHLEPFGRTQGKLRERSFPVRIIGTGAAQIDTRSTLCYSHYYARNFVRSKS
ncbi:MAG: hypothetical protein HYU31_02845 [Deltaproteobacteria bacterium]|nr:hypothetical protein [Deltaproteobacteria bacterium]MBI2365537.1 hypothetical protein [Deltaproteobacteria bacterium]